MKKIGLKMLLLTLLSLAFLGVQAVEKPGGKLPGKFSVSPTRMVRFSKGNLQYKATTKVWRFAPNQYDVCKYQYTALPGPNHPSSYSGWVDRFGWGTSGCGLPPYATTRDSKMYVMEGEVDIAGTYYDWGMYNKISNGGNRAGLWRTLTAKEWRYLIKDRPNAIKLHFQATVCGMPGLIILPDAPKEIPFAYYHDSSGKNYYRGNYFEDNVYNKQQWEEWENMGAVFLPAAGWREGCEVVPYTSVPGEETSWSGHYWSSTAYGSISSVALSFGGNYCYVDGLTQYRSSGYSVRLVSDL